MWVILIVDGNVVVVADVFVEEFIDGESKINCESFVVTINPPITFNYDHFSWDNK